MSLLESLGIFIVLPSYVNQRKTWIFIIHMVQKSPGQYKIKAL